MTTTSHEHLILHVGSRQRQLLLSNTIIVHGQILHNFTNLIVLLAQVDQCLPGHRPERLRVIVLPLEVAASHNYLNLVRVKRLDPVRALLVVPLGIPGRIRVLQKHSQTSLNQVLNLAFEQKNQPVECQCAVVCQLCGFSEELDDESL